MCFLKACFFQMKPRSLLFHAYLGIMQSLYNYILGSAVEHFQVLFLNRRGHKINFVCHLCLLGIKDHALFCLSQNERAVLATLESLILHYWAKKLFKLSE